MNLLIYIIVGLGAGIVTGLAGLSAAVIITPLLVSACGWVSWVHSINWYDCWKLLWLFIQSITIWWTWYDCYGYHYSMRY